MRFQNLHRIDAMRIDGRIPQCGHQRSMRTNGSVSDSDIHAAIVWDKGSGGLMSNKKQDEACGRAMPTVQTSIVGGPTAYLLIKLNEPSRAGASVLMMNCRTTKYRECCERLGS